MNPIRRSTFLLGFLIASLVAIIVWYYQKSTSAEDGALDVLERYAQAQARVRQLEGRPASHPPVSTSNYNGGTITANGRNTEIMTNQLQRIKGIGPGYAQRLVESGITSLLELAEADTEGLRRIVGPRANVEQWIADAHELLRA